MNRRIKNLPRVMGFVSSLLITSFVSTLSSGQTIGRIQPQPDSNRLRYYGVASVDSTNPSETWRSAEQRAWAEGLNYLESYVKKLKQSKGLAAEISNEDRQLIKQSTKSRGVTYFGDSRVKVALESDISQIILAN